MSGASSSLLLALLAAASSLLYACDARKLQFVWPDPKTGTGMQGIHACKVDGHNHTRHHVEAAGGLVAWSYGWRSFSYQLVEADTPMDWASCLASCVHKAPPGYTMLNIDSLDENNVILALLSNTPGYNCTTGIGRSAWLAVTDVLDEGKMTNLLDGSPPKWSTWAEYQPNNNGGDGQDCVRILKSGTLEGKWEDIGCNVVWRLQQQCICKHDSTPAQTDARFLGSHPQGTKKYWSLRTPRSWEGCRIGCLKEAHGRMVMPKDVEDHRSVIMLSEPAARDLGQTSIWFGANDMLQEGQWWWLDGTPVDTSAPWAAGQPDNSRPLGQGLDEDCMLATVGFAPGPGLLHDTFCGRMGLCVCETD